MLKGDSEDIDMSSVSCRGQSGPTIRNYNYHSYSPPPVYGGYGPGYGYGGGGIQLMPSFGVPVSSISAYSKYCLYASYLVTTQWFIDCDYMQIFGGGSFFTIVIGLVSQGEFFVLLTFPFICGLNMFYVTLSLMCSLLAVCFVNRAQHSTQRQQPWQAG